MDGDTPRVAGGQPVIRILVVPVEQASVQDTWHSAGLRGAGSDHFVLDDVYVPAQRVIDPSPIMSGNSPVAWHPYPFYRCAAPLVYRFAGVQLGIARSALEEFIALAQLKTPAQARQPLREQSRTQSAVARAQAQIEAARIYVHAALGNLWDAVVTTARSTPEQRARALLAQICASENAVDVVSTLAHLAGTTAHYTPNRFDQALRGVRAAAGAPSCFAANL
jgi:alkylation response protein AidB-like acyl-CoA dehydrogenase